MLLKTNKFILFLACFMSLACGHIKTSKQINKTNKYDQTNTQKPDLLEEDSKPVLKEVPRNPKLGLILGPGLIKSFAHVGVLKQFAENKIPVDYIVGSEWGALIAGIYAHQGKLHDLEWKLYKLKLDQLFSKSFLSFGSKEKSVNWFDKYLQINLANSALAKTQIPFSCPTRSIKTGRLFWPRNGSLKETIKKCVAYPPVFSPYKGYMSGAMTVGRAVNYLRSRGAELVIFVNVLGSSPIQDSIGAKDYKSVMLWNEVKKRINNDSSLADVVIDVKTNKYGMLNWKSRKSLIKAGESAGKKWSKKLIDQYNF